MGGPSCQNLRSPRGNITNHDPQIEEGLYRDLTDEIIGDLASKLYNRKRRIPYELDETVILHGGSSRGSLYMKVGLDRPLTLARIVHLVTSSALKYCHAPVLRWGVGVACGV